MRKLIPLCILALVLTGCVHESPFNEGEAYFQAMGRDAEIVLTADTQRLPLSDSATTGMMGDIIERSSRLSVAFYKDSYSEADRYPASLSDFDFYGGIEGDYGSFTINTALSWSKEFHKEKVDGVKYYTNEAGSIELAVPESGIILFASKDYVDAYRRTVEERVLLIDDETARLMSSSVLGIYVKEPETMIDLGFELPLSVIMKMSDALIFVNEDGEGGYELNAQILMDDESLASTLCQLLRQQVLQQLRLEGVRPDFAALSEQYKAEGRTVIVRGMEMSRDQLMSFSSAIDEVMGGLG